MTNTKQAMDTREWALRASLPLSMFVAAVLIGLFGHILLARYKGENQPVSTETRFYCNSKALNPAERAAHKELTDRLIAARHKITEATDGYEFQFDASAISFPDLANWSVAEAKCCPFFDFHLDLENSGGALGLRLSGPVGVKPFIRLEFAVPAK